MFSQRFSALKADINKRTLASFYIATSVEIASRRDTSILEGDRFVLNNLIMAYRGLENAWVTLYSDEDPIEVIQNFDGKFSNFSKVESFFFNRILSKSSVLFMNDLIYTLTADELMDAAHEEGLIKCLQAIAEKGEKVSF